MKKLKLFFACLLMAVLSIGQVWGATATSTLTFSAKCDGSGTADDDVAWTVTSDGTESNYDGTKGIHYGTSSAQVQYIRLSTSGISGTISQVVVNASVGSGVSATVAVKVGTTDFTCGGNTTTSLSTSATNYTFTGSASGDILVEITKPSKAAKALYCKSVAVTYDAGGTPDPTLESIVISGTPDKTVYEAGENFDPTGLVATGYYDNSTDADLTSSVDWAYTPAGALTQGLTSVNVTATKGTVVGNKDVDITVNAASPKSSLIFEAACGGSGTADDGAVWTVTSDGAESNFDATFGIHYGTNSANVTYLQLATSDISGEITKVVVNARDAQAKATISVTVGGTAFTCASATATNTSADYVFTGTGSGEIVVRVDRGSSMSKAIYVKSVVVTYVSDGKEAAGLTFDAAQKLVKVGGTLAAPILSTADGFDGTVTYASSDEAVVKVNASTGAITEIVAAGKAVITAHSDATENFKEGSASYTIFVAEQAGTNEDPLTEASAKALIDLGCTLTVHVNGLVLSQNSTNYTVTLTDGFQFYKAKDLNNVAFESAYLAAGDEVTAVGALKKFSSTYELDEGCYLTFYEAATTPLTPIANDKDHPYTVAQALAFAAAPTTYDLSDHVFIQGVVYKANSFNSDNGTYNIYIKDAGTSEDDGKFEFFKCSGLYQVGEDVVPFEEGDVQEGDEVIGYGVMTYYPGGSIWEFGQPNQLVSLNRPAVAVTGVTVESTASVAVGGTVTLHAAVVPENASNKTINWSVQSGNAYASVADGVVTGIAEGTAVIRAASDEDASIYAECTVTVAPLSPWATVYTSNIELSVEGGTSASEAKVKFYGEETEYAALKAGTSGTAGAVVINVPAGATALHFHAYSWYNETVELTVSAPTGVTVTPSAAIGINQNSGISNNSPFTLEDGSTPQFDAYYAVSLSGNSEPIDLTISATSGKRFVLFGVNQVGGLVLESISVGGTASVLEYTDGQHFDPTGLSVTGHYSDASTAPITEDIVWAFDPDPLTEGTTSVSVTATAAGFTSAAFVVNGLTVAGAAPLSPWATTWTSNLDDITGSKVKFYGEETEYAALKAGSSGTAGSATLNIPAQATELHLHAYGWNSEDVTLSITAPAGVTVTPASITLNRNSGFASNSPFTLAEGSTPQTDAYYALSLSGNTDAIELTISATAGKRFLLFGVNQVGGVLPELQSIAISGDLTNKSYKAGQSLDMTGLTVMATYTLGGTPQTSVDVTNDPGLTWTYDPLVENQTEVTVTAHFGEETANKTITGLEVASADPKIYVSTLNVNFASVEVGESVPAAETVTVTLTNVASVTATLGGTNPEAFSISTDALTESGDITISILANTDAAASYAATLTISDDAGNAESKVVNISITVNEVVTPETPVSTTSKWVPATEIADGMQVLITGVKSDDVYAMGEQKNNNRAAVAASVDGEGVLTPGENTMAFTLVAQGDGTYALRTSNGKYLYAAASGSNYLKTQDEVDVNAKWTMTVASASAEGSSNRHVMQFNTGSTLFSCYASAGGSGMAAIKLYVPQTTPPTPAYTDIRTGLTACNYYTVCWPKAMTAIKGGTLWSFAGKDADMAYLIQEDAPFEAGKPYIIYATAEKLEAVVEGGDAPAGDNNGLYGTLSYMDATALAEAGATYMLKSNALRPIGTNNHLDANRAYVILDNITGGKPSNVPAHKVRSMPMQKDQAQGIEDVQGDNVQSTKVLINGNLYILRGEKVYDATGRLVK
ncbi:MAG: Ig-like domain-containing protein [Paludibacteraceae bacterium]|nr:Ig-like domain-containing protein [Paludibacteraceae bacterium]